MLLAYVDESGPERSYMFGSVDHPYDRIGAPPELLELFRRQPKTVRVQDFTNDLDALARYNQNVVYQCHHAVYSSSQVVQCVKVRISEPV